MAEHSYDTWPLKEDVDIRVLKIEPVADFNEPIVCDLEVVSLRSQYRYVVLSYCWGPLIFDCNLICRGKLFAITQGLDVALRRVRSQNELPIWVDQVCVDQLNLEERNAQVQLMGEIYSKAEAVFIYLGEASPAVEKSLLVALQTTQFNSSASFAHATEVFPYIYSREYLNRVWIKQEVAACKTRIGICGSTSFPWDHLYRQLDSFERAILARKSSSNAHIYNQSAAIWMRGACRELLNLRTICLKHESKTLRLFDLVSMCRQSNASDDRDKIFALIGLATDAEQFPKPNYTLTATRVFYDFAKVFVAQGHGLEVVMQAGIRRKRHLMPSWVPDWSIRMNYKNPVRLDTELSVFSAGLHMSPQVDLDDSEKAVFVKCKIFDSIADANPRWNLKINWSKAALAWIHSSVEMIERRLSTFAEAELSKLVIMDGPTDVWQLSGNELELFREMIKEFEKGWSTREELIAVWGRKTKAGNQSFMFHSAAHPFSPNLTGQPPPRCFISRSGNLGTAPRDVQVGDLIIVLAGAPVPSFIRKHGDGYLFLGNGYVRGIMYGEISERSDIVEEMIRIV